MMDNKFNVNQNIRNNIQYFTPKGNRGINTNKDIIDNTDALRRDLKRKGPLDVLVDEMKNLSFFFILTTFISYINEKLWGLPELVYMGVIVLLLFNMVTKLG